MIFPSCVLVVFWVLLVFCLVVFGDGLDVWIIRMLVLCC